MIGLTGFYYSSLCFWFDDMISVKLSECEDKGRSIGCLYYVKSL